MTTKPAVDRKAQVDQLLATLDAQVSELANTDQWRELLRAATVFHKYSFGNIMLIAKQCPNATQVAGYRAWQALGRQVRKGEKSIKILAPMTYRNRDAEEDSDAPKYRLAGFTVVSVFDVSQTEGDALPQAPSWIAQHGDSAALHELFSKLASQVRAAGYTLSIVRPASGAHGETNFSRHTVEIRPDVEMAETVRILAHELAHIVADHKSRTLPSEQAETEEADSIAFVVLGALGLDISDAATQYVLDWSDSKPAVLREAAQAVQQASQKILDAFDAPNGVPAAA